MRYTYKFVNGESISVEVSEEMLAVLQDEDRLESNNGAGNEQLADVLVKLVRPRTELLADGACQREKSVESVVLPGIVRIAQYALFGRKDVHSLPPRIKSARPCGQKPHEPRRGGSKPLASKHVKAFRGS